MKKCLKHLDHWRMPKEVLDSYGYVTEGDTQGWMWQINALRVIASWGGEWDHVSVSHQTRIPTWEEMCWIKGLFFDDEEAVMQLHPPKSEYVNNHSRCLHLWRPQNASIPLPPSIYVGIKEAGVLT